ncbi:hypothetical protein G6F66_014339 [Rhizopus arrhizus]|nr:hypothetical protein G6F66_014339 [Rhizopus arrhizus]
MMRDGLSTHGFGSLAETDDGQLAGGGGAGVPAGTGDCGVPGGDVGECAGSGQIDRVARGDGDRGDDPDVALGAHARGIAHTERVGGAAGDLAGRDRQARGRAVQPRDADAMAAPSTVREISVAGSLGAGAPAMAVGWVSG